MGQPGLGRRQWTGAYFNLPGFLIVFILTLLLVRGVKESAETNNIMVTVKDRRHPDLPGGRRNAGEARQLDALRALRLRRNRHRRRHRFLYLHRIRFGLHRRRGIAQSAKRFALRHHHVAGGLHVLYVGVAVVLLGMMKYTTFVSGAAAEAPVAYAMKYLGVHPFFRSVIVIGALTGMISSLLVFQYGQARIWYAMSRDGLLPKLFSAVHPKYKTPYWSTWIACFAVGIPAGLVDIGDAADLANIGTLFAFVLVSLGVIMLRRRQPDRKRAFRVPLSRGSR
jgi:basic amino acid/polyamine antiporter, APA family